MKKSLIGIVFLAIFMGFACEVKGESNTSENAVPQKTEAKKQVDDNSIKAPDFTLADLNGNWVSLADMKGKVVLLNFWGTWCPPCRREIPDFIKLYEKHKESGLEIVGVTLRSGTPEQIQKFVDDWAMNYTILTDIQGYETQMVTQRYGQAIGEPITGVPTTFIINRDGNIVKTYVGPRTEEMFFRDLKPYL